MVEVIAAIAVLGVISVVLVNLMKTQSKNTVSSQVDTEVIQLKTELQGIFNNPAHCNANFMNKLGGAPINVTAINLCSVGGTGACRVAGVGTAVPQTKMTPTTTTWNGTYTNRVRVKSLTLNIDDVNPAGGSSPLALTQIALTVNIQKKYQTRSDTAAEVVKDDQFKVFTTGVYDGTKIVGCPNSFNSTVVY